MTDPYRQSDLLFKVNKLKSKGKDSYDHVDIGVVKQNGRTVDEVFALASAKNSSRVRYEVKPIWIGWTICGVVQTDGKLIEKHGLLKDDLSDA